MENREFEGLTLSQVLALPWKEANPKLRRRRRKRIETARQQRIWKKRTR